MERNSLAGEIKDILESETKDKFLLEVEPKVGCETGTSWLLHLPLAENSIGWVDRVYEKADKVYFKTPILFDVYRRLEYDYPAQRRRKPLGQAIDNLDQKEVRMGFADVIPAIVSFFDELEKVVEDINARYSTRLKTVNSSGSILVMTELAEEDARDREVVLRNIGAIMEFDSRVSGWLRNVYDEVYRLKAGSPRDLSSSEASLQTMPEEDLETRFDLMHEKQ